MENKSESQNVSYEQQQQICLVNLCCIFLYSLAYRCMLFNAFSFIFTLHLNNFFFLKEN